MTLGRGCHAEELRIEGTSYKRLELLFGSVAVASAAIALAHLAADGYVALVNTQDAAAVVEATAKSGGIGPDVIYANCQSVANCGPCP